MVVAVVDAHFIIILILVIIDDHSAHQLPHGHLLQGTGGQWGGSVPVTPHPCVPQLPGALTSPLELMRAVRRLSPEPQLLWAFHTKLLGGLWVAPAPEAQI